MRSLFSAFCGITVIGLSIYACIVSGAFLTFGWAIIGSFVFGILATTAGSCFNKHQTFWYALALIGLLGCGLLVCAAIVKGLVFDYRFGIAILVCGLAGCIAESL